MTGTLLASTTLSPQQSAFVDWFVNGTGSCVLEAVAGSGKTFSILQAVIAAINSGRSNIAILAYNKKIAEEIKAKLKNLNIDWKQAIAGTVHSFGFTAYRKKFGSVKVDEWKVANVYDDYIKDVTNVTPRAVIQNKQDIIKLVSLAKQNAIGVISSIDNFSIYADIVDRFDLFDDIQAEAEEMDTDGTEIEDAITVCIRAAIEILKISNSITNVIDFDDMVYLPLVLKLRFWQYDDVIVDEAQDTNAARRALVRAITKAGGRVTAVGDSRQAIYGFTGADADSLDLIARDFDAIRLPLTVTYRCPKAVVKFAHNWVSHIEAHENNIEGSVSTIKLADFFARTDLNGEAAVLCRNTKPLVETAFALIRKKIGCRVEGREVGKSLTKLATRWKRIKTLAALDSKLTDYLERERTKYLAAKKEQKAQEIDDKVQTLKVIIDQCREEKKDSIDDVVNYITNLFDDNVTGILTLSTIHKSKGREWKKVFWLDRKGTCPSKYARQDWQKGQEANLQYVACTRAMEELIEVTI